MNARLLLLALLSLPLGHLTAAPVSARNLPALMPSPESALQHADDIHLTPDQREKLESSVRDLQATTQRFSEQLRQESDTLAQLLAAGTADEAAVAAQFDKVLAAEDEVKRARMKMSLQTRAVLTPEQRDKLATLQSGGTRVRMPSPERQELVARMERVKELIARAKGEGRDLTPMREVWKRVDELTRDGKIAEASQLLDETAQGLESALAAPPARK
jgi:Spy/CpxP family protein refolding chaperone